MDVHEKLDLILEILGGHSALLGALINGQQEIKADLDGGKLVTFKRFDDVNKKNYSSEASRTRWKQKSSFWKIGHGRMN